MSQTEPIYVVASDMDGTFLRDDKTFDEPRFRSILQRMHAKGCKFVVASGNQYIQLKQSFCLLYTSDAADDIALV